MKKLISLLLAVVLCFGLVACGSKTLGEEVKGGMTEEHVAIVTEVVKEYMDTDNYKALVERAECKGVKSTMYYEASFDEPKVELILILVELDMDDKIVGSDRLMVIDLVNDAAYDAIDLDLNNFMGQMETYEDLMTMALGGFNSWLMFKDASCIVTENEVRTPATEDQIAAINASLAG